MGVSGRRLLVCRLLRVQVHVVRGGLCWDRLCSAVQHCGRCSRPSRGEDKHDLRSRRQHAAPTHPVKERGEGGDAHRRGAAAGGVSPPTIVGTFERRDHAVVQCYVLCLYSRPIAALSLCCAFSVCIHPPTHTHTAWHTRRWRFGLCRRRNGSFVLGLRCRSQAAVDPTTD